RIVSLVLRQFFVYTLAFYAYFGALRLYFPRKRSAAYILIAFTVIVLARTVLFYALKKYRAYLKGNIRNVIIIGTTPAAVQLKDFFNKRTDLGYQLQAVFGNTLSDTGGNMSDCYEFLKTNSIDEIYCAIGELTDEEVNAFVKYANENYVALKFIPETEKIFSRRLAVDYYDYLPVIAIEEIALNKTLNRIVKRIFDIVISSFMILFVLSWLVPLMFVLIKAESRGPLFYKHKRNGINYAEFTCYKFRSLRHEARHEMEQVHKEDERVTGIGKFIRRTSIDEIPQFINVFLGQMSVVGPRPHPTIYTKAYAKQIDKYNFIFRHSVKPGITGLAQVKGYRGEIQTKEDIVNRVKYDIFYIENWSLFLDIKIIAETIYLFFKGQEKAY
ncbi:MAG: exopolysaccharide biosynthesis polyprenyl glycosylphosphotransferase, partial [Sinomicrobium sp.]|nr:exopolysaccharide biosynthesis polyprenyl glycosylphosphotransferase [Sinomicrobium sp.]